MPTEQNYSEVLKPTKVICVIDENKYDTLVDVI